MAEAAETQKKVPKFAGITILSGLSKTNYFFFFFNTFLLGIFLSVTAVLQPAFMKDIIQIDQDFAGTIISFLQNMSQIATLLFVAYLGALSDKIGRKIMILASFISLFIAFYLFKESNAIAIGLGINPETAATICAWLSFSPDKAAAFTSFAPGLLVSYVARFLIGIGLILGYPQLIIMVGDYTSQNDRGKGMGLNGMTAGVASLVMFGAFGVIMKKYGVLAGFDTCLILAAVGAVLTAVFMKDRMPEKPAEKQGLKDVFPILKESKAMKAAYWTALITRGDIVVLATYLVVWGVLVGPEHGYVTATKASLMATIPMMVMGVISMFAFPVLGVMLDKKGRMPVVILAVICAGISMLLIAAAPNPFHWLCLVAALFAGIGMAGSIAGANTLAMDASPITLLGAVMGGLGTMQPIGILFFLGVGGVLFDSVAPGAAFALKGVASLLLVIWLFSVRKAVTQEIQATFTMEWEEDAKKAMMKIPGGVRQGAIEGTEAYAQDQGVTVITADFCAELRKMMAEAEEG
jgi:MFS family permease